MATALLLVAILARNIEASQSSATFFNPQISASPSLAKPKPGTAHGTLDCEAAVEAAVWDSLLLPLRAEQHGLGLWRRAPSTPLAFANLSDRFWAQKLIG